MGYVLLLFAGGNAQRTFTTLYIYKVQNYGIYGHQEVGFHPFSPLDRALSHRQQDRVCLYWPFKRGQVEPHKHALQPQGLGQNVGHAWQNATYQPFYHQRFVVSGGPSWLWICQEI